MAVTLWLKSLNGRRPRKSPISRRGFVPRLETLEVRMVLSTVHAQFLDPDLSTPTSRVFPSNLFTVEAPDNLTGLRVSLPTPDENEFRSDFDDIQVINTLDGFNIQPRLSIPFTTSCCRTPGCAGSRRRIPGSRRSTSAVERISDRRKAVHRSSGGTGRSSRVPSTGMTGFLSVSTAEESGGVDSWACEESGPRAISTAQRREWCISVVPPAEADPRRMKRV